MVTLVTSPAMREKLTTKHRVQEQEIEECFLEHEGKYLVDTREEHNTDPPTMWFIGRTYRGRLLKIIFVHRDGNIYIKSAYEPTEAVIRIYKELNNSEE
ncbi:ADP-ribosyl-(dinitrogen reductase) hydrolase [Allopusillimonas ginsengisoli]|nr:ADP-ribosyl-(dinitrogen reductase) hydrolase [Allopusillimonas ginsengisoli]